MPDAWSSLLALGVFIWMTHFMRYTVLDEFGQALRRFWTLPEAQAFCLEGYSVRTEPKAPKPPLHWAFSKLLDNLGEAPY